MLEGSDMALRVVLTKIESVIFGLAQITSRPMNSSHEMPKRTDFSLSQRIKALGGHKPVAGGKVAGN